MKFVYFSSAIACLITLPFGAQVSLKGYVHTSGSPLFSATATLLETGKTVYTDSNGVYQFDFEYQYTVGIDKSFEDALPVGPQLSGTSMELYVPHAADVFVESYSLDGRLSGHFSEYFESGKHRIAIDNREQGLSGSRFFRITSKVDENAPGAMLYTQNQLPLAKGICQNPTLVVSREGYFRHQSNVNTCQGVVEPVELKPCHSFKKCLQDFLGDDNDFRIVYKRQIENDSIEIATIQYKDIIDAESLTPRIIESTGRIVLPSLSSDGSTFAYHSGKGYSKTDPDATVFYVDFETGELLHQHPNGTFPQFQTVDGEEIVVWATGSAYENDTDPYSFTYMQSVSNWVPSNQPVKLVDASYNRGISPSGKYLMDKYVDPSVLRLADSTLVPIHTYGSDSLQITYPVWSRNPDKPNQMAFLDFGTNIPRNNGIVPSTYKWREVILFADPESETPGKIVDYLHIPPHLKSERNVWQQLSWSSDGEYIVASTRKPKGLLFEYSGIRLIRISTKESINVFQDSTAREIAAWVKH